MKDIDLQEVQHVYVGVWSSDRRDGMGGFFEKWMSVEARSSLPISHFSLFFPDIVS